MTRNGVVREVGGGLLDTKWTICHPADVDWGLSRQPISSSSQLVTWSPIFYADNECPACWSLSSALAWDDFIIFLLSLWHSSPCGGNYQLVWDNSEISSMSLTRSKVCVGCEECHWCDRNSLLPPSARQSYSMAGRCITARLHYQKYFPVLTDLTLCVESCIVSYH